MTKKDYELIADSILLYRQYDTDYVNIGFVYDLVEKFEADNPKFDRDKFLTACGIQTEPKEGGK